MNALIRVKQRLEVVAGPSGAPWAVFGAESEPRPADVTWSGPLEAFDGLELAGKLLPASAIFSGRLTARWNRLVVCTAEFQAAHEQAAAAPGGFGLEVLS